MNNDYEVVHKAPTSREYAIIRKESGLLEKSIEGVRIGLGNSLFAVSIYHDRTLVGMGRITGDGGASFQIVDVVVKPSYRRQGMAREIMDHLMKYLSLNTYPGSYVSLIADEPADRLYQEFGFNYSIPTSHAMIRIY